MSLSYKINSMSNDPISDPVNLKLYIPKTDNAIVDAFEIAVNSFKVANKVDGAKYYIPENADINAKPKEIGTDHIITIHSVPKHELVPNFKINEKGRPIEKYNSPQEHEETPAANQPQPQQQNKKTNKNEKNQNSKKNSATQQQKDKVQAEEQNLPENIPKQPNPATIIPTQLPPSLPQSEEACTYPPPLPLEADPIRNQMLHAWYWAGYYTGLSDAQKRLQK